jgi:DnaK suppressor protein
MKQLSDADLATLAQRLEALRLQALDEIRNAGAVADDDAGEVRDRAEEAEAEREDDLHFAEIEIDRAALRDIALAQHRMATGDYGLCVDCGEAIPRERLFAQPAAIRCAACQSATEARRATR